MESFLAAAVEGLHETMRSAMVVYSFISSSVSSALVSCSKRRAGNVWFKSGASFVCRYQESGS